MKLVKIYATRNEMEASVIQGVLRVYGVEAVLKDRSLKSAGYPGVPGSKGGSDIEIWVDHEVADLALEVLEDNANISGPEKQSSSENVNGFLTKLRNWLRNN